MNKKSLLIAALAGVALTVNAFAYSPKDSAKAPATPPPRVVASSVVKPTDLPMNFAGQVINVEFALDESGSPQDIKVLWVEDKALKKQLVAAFSQWRFEKSASSDAATAPKRFILPISLQPEV
jgi:hypothetical protein